MDKMIETNGITLHAVDHPGGEPTLVYLPGLTANAHLFDGVLAAGIGGKYRVLALDLRGRGLSDKPENAYTMDDHAKDVLGVLDAEGIDKAILVGHSFGGLLSMFFAATYPERVEHIVIIDASKASTHPRVAEMIKPALARLGQTLPSVDAYLAAMQQAPYLHGMWNSALEAYFRADMNVNEDGTAQAHSTPEAIGAAIDGIVALDWDTIVPNVQCPAILLNATEPYGGASSPPLVSEADARETAVLIPNCQYKHMPGNHVTMVFGDNAKFVADAIIEFIKNE